MAMRRLVVALAVGVAMAVGVAPATATTPATAAATSAATSAVIPVPTATQPAVAAALGPTTTTLGAAVTEDGVTTITVTVAAARGRTRGVVTVRDGDSLLAELPVAGAPVAFTTSALAVGEHNLTANFAGAPPFSNSRSDTVVVGSGPPAESAGSFTVAVVIPAGALTITTPYGPSRPLVLPLARLDAGASSYSASAPVGDIVITDTRPGDQGFSASVVVSAFAGPSGRSFPGSRAGLTGLRAVQVPGNALRARDVRLVNTRPNAPGLGSPRVFAVYPAGLSIGTVHVTGLLEVAGIPTSTRAGVYVARVTLTAL